MDRNSFIIEVSNEQQSKKLKSINNINEIPVNMCEYFQNMTMGLIYVYEYDLNEFDEFRNGLIADYNLKDLQQATWIKPGNPLSIPIILNILKLPENKLKPKSTSTSHHQWYALTSVTPGKIVKETSSYVDAATKQTTQVVTTPATQLSATTVVMITPQNPASVQFIGTRRKSVSFKLVRRFPDNKQKLLLIYRTQIS